MDDKCEEWKGSGLTLWPEELLKVIFGKLNLHDLASSADVCDRWAQIASKTEITLTVNRALIEEHGMNFFDRLARILEDEKYQNLVVAADIRQLNFAELSALFPLLYKCKNLKSLRLTNLFLRFGYFGECDFWQVLVSLGGKLRHVDILDWNALVSEVILYLLIPLPYNMLTGVEKLTFLNNDKICEELVLANQDSLREMYVDSPDEDMMRVISRCTKLSVLSITCENIGHDLIRYIQPFTTLRQYEYRCSDSFDSVQVNCPHVTKLILFYSDKLVGENSNKLEHFPNVKELTWDFVVKPEDMTETIANIVEFSSKLDKLNVLRFRLDIRHMEKILPAFDKMPLLSKIILTTSTRVCRLEYKRRIENASNLRARGFKALFVDTGKDCRSIVYRKTRNLEY